MSNLERGERKEVRGKRGEENSGSQGRTALSFIEYLREDVGLEPGELNTATRDIDVWRRMVGAIRVRQLWPT